MDFPRTSQYSKSPLATKLLRAVLSVYLVVALIVTSLQLVFEFRDERMRLQEEINNSAVAFLPVLELALWNLDFEQLDATFEAIWLNQAIGRVSITDDLGQELVSSARDYTQSVLGSMTLPWYEFGYDIYYSDSRTENQYVGRLNLASNSIVLLQRAMNTFIFTLVNAAIKTLVLWLIFYYAVIKYIAKPLGHLGKEIDAFDPDSPMQGKVDSNLSPNQAKNELTELAATFANLKSTLLEKNNQIQIRQETLEDAVEELTRVSNAKSVFLAHMSHELRTPLNGILGMVEFLNETTLDKKQRSYVETLSDSGKQLLSVINNVLDISKIESGKLQLEAVEFDLKKLIDQSINTFALIAKKKNLEFDCDTKNLLTRKVLGDPVKITQVFNNLLGNAIKFTEEGSVVVIVSSKFSGSDVLFETKISDSGIGISEEQQKKLFKSFSQVDESTTRKFGGTGLGLAISNQLVESMGGRISVSSIEGEGATFEFFLTLKTPS